MPFACAARRKSLLGVAAGPRPQAGRRKLHCYGRVRGHDVRYTDAELDAAGSRRSPLSLVNDACSCCAPRDR